MKKTTFTGELKRLVPEYDDQVQVVFQDMETGEIYDVEELRYDSAPTDGEGNPTGTGSTLFIRGCAV